LDRIDIDRFRCTGCMRCARDCVAAALRQEQGQVIVADPGSCTRCSHCLAVCPVNAVIHGGLDSSRVRPVKEDKILPQSFETIVTGRRSIRQFKRRPLDRETLTRLLNLASVTPTASNSQHVSYTVITDPDTLGAISQKVFSIGVRAHRCFTTFPGSLVYRFMKHFAWSDTLSRYLDPMPYYMAESRRGRDYILHHAPALILIQAPRGAKFGCENCNLAAANIMNHAYALGLGTCYIGFLNLALAASSRLRRLAGVEKGRKAHACLVAGIPAYGHPSTAVRNLPKVTWVGPAHRNLETGV